MSPSRRCHGGAPSATTAGGAAVWPHARGARVGSGGPVPAASRDDGPSAAGRCACWGCSASLLILSGMMLPLVPLSAQWVFWALAAVTIVAAVAAIATHEAGLHGALVCLVAVGHGGVAVLRRCAVPEHFHDGRVCRGHPRDVSVRDHVGPTGGPRVVRSHHLGVVHQVGGGVGGGLARGSLDHRVECGGRGPGRPARSRSRQRDVLQPAHMARFGSELFTKHLLSIEMAGALLLVALVGAISIMIQTAPVGRRAAEGGPKP